MKKERLKPSTQVGGTHYKQAIEPIEYIEANNIPFHEANVIKYISRWKKKNGIEDLLKSHWYILRLIQLELEKLPKEEQDEYREKYKEVLH